MLKCKGCFCLRTDWNISAIVPVSTFVNVVVDTYFVLRVLRVYPTQTWELSLRLYCLHYMLAVSVVK